MSPSAESTRSPMIVIITGQVGPRQASTTRTRVARPTTTLRTTIHTGGLSALSPVSAARKAMSESPSRKASTRPILFWRVSMVALHSRCGRGVEVVRGSRPERSQHATAPHKARHSRAGSLGSATALRHPTRTGTEGPRRRKAQTRGRSGGADHRTYVAAQRRGAQHDPPALLDDDERATPGRATERLEDDRPDQGRLAVAPDARLLDGAVDLLLQAARTSARSTSTFGSTMAHACTVPSWRAASRSPRTRSA